MSFEFSTKAPPPYHNKPNLLNKHKSQYKNFVNFKITRRLSCDPNEDQPN